MADSKSQQPSKESSPVQVPTSMEILYKEYFDSESKDKPIEEPGNSDKKKVATEDTPTDIPEQSSAGKTNDADKVNEPITPETSKQNLENDSGKPPDDSKSASPEPPAKVDTQVELTKYKEFIKELKDNPTKAWRKFEKDLELPALEVVQQIIKTSDSLDESSIRTQLKVYQKNLKSEIEKEFNLDPGTFRYDADEAVDVDSPSYAFAEKTRRYEEQLRNELQSKLQFAKEQAELMKKVQEEDKKWFKETFYKNDPAKADEAIRGLSLIPAKILSGELPPHKHPFSLRTMLLGVYFDELVENIKKETEENIKRAYEERGMFLNKKAPEDLKKGARGYESVEDPFANSHNPMERHVGSLIRK